MSTLEDAEAVSEPQSNSATDRYLSWGRYPKATHRKVFHVYWRDQLPEILRRAEPASLLPYGMGRSYGDSCLNAGLDLLDCSMLNRILECDWETGKIRVEAGLSLHDLLQIIVRRGWFLPVTPGTKFVTIGGAIANDVHGKNHHRAGTFGCHVTEIALCRSDAELLCCSLSENADLFRATIGGLGLTGVITSAEIQLKKIPGNVIETETIPFHSFEQFLELSRSSDETREYTVGWIDCLAGNQTRGIFFRGNHAPQTLSHQRARVSVPFAPPEFVMNRASVSLFNRAYYGFNERKSGSKPIHYDPFFYPLDGILNWNLLYGRSGLVQHQCVVPSARADVIKNMIAAVAHSGEACFLAVLKKFGDRKSPGLLSFPRPGLTLTLDLPMRGTRTLMLLDSLDELVLASGGAVYPAKDARMSPAMFVAGFPNWDTFMPFIDPKFSSSFWRRVTADRTR